MNNWQRDETGWFEVRFPWKFDPRTFEKNRIQASQRDENLNKQLSKNVEVQGLFSEQNKKMIQKGVLKNVDANYPSRYLPLLVVID